MAPLRGSSPPAPLRGSSAPIPCVGPQLLHPCRVGCISKVHRPGDAGYKAPLVPLPHLVAGSICIEVSNMLLAPTVQRRKPRLAHPQMEMAFTTARDQGMMSWFVPREGEACDMYEAWVGKVACGYPGPVQLILRVEPGTSRARARPGAWTCRPIGHPVRGSLRQYRDRSPGATRKPQTHSWAQGSSRVEVKNNVQWDAELCPRPAEDPWGCCGVFIGPGRSVGSGNLKPKVQPFSTTGVTQTTVWPGKHTPVCPILRSGVFFHRLSFPQKVPVPFGAS